MRRWPSSRATTRAARALTLGLLGAGLGCGLLAVEPADSGLSRVAKYSVRLPLSLLTLSASEYRIQAIESGRVFEQYVEAQRERIAEARAAASAAETYPEYRQWIERAEALEAELEQRIAAREAARAVGVPQPPSPPPEPGCRSRSDGDRVVTQCR